MTLSKQHCEWQQQQAEKLLQLGSASGAADAAANSLAPSGLAALAAAAGLQDGQTAVQLGSTSPAGLLHQLLHIQQQQQPMDVQQLAGALNNLRSLLMQGAAGNLTEHQQAGTAYGSYADNDANNSSPAAQEGSGGSSNDASGQSAATTAGPFNRAGISASVRPHHCQQQRHWMHTQPQGPVSTGTCLGDSTADALVPEDRPIVKADANSSAAAAAADQDNAELLQQAANLLNLRHVQRQQLGSLDWEQQQQVDNRPPAKRRRQAASCRDAAMAAGSQADAYDWQQHQQQQQKRHRAACSEQQWLRQQRPNNVYLQDAGAADAGNQRSGKNHSASTAHGTAAAQQPDDDMLAAAAAMMAAANHPAITAIAEGLSDDRPNTGSAAAAAASGATTGQEKLDHGEQEGPAAAATEDESENDMLDGHSSKDANTSNASAGQQSNGKKQRLIWTAELHARFLNAVHQLGIRNAVPKTILQMMGVEGMTRENVASHLQKYRLYLKRVAGLPPNAPLSNETLQQVQQAMQSQHMQKLGLFNPSVHSMSRMGHGRSSGSSAGFASEPGAANLGGNIATRQQSMGSMQSAGSGCMPDAAALAAKQAAEATAPPTPGSRAMTQQHQLHALDTTVGADDRYRHQQKAHLQQQQQQQASSVGMLAQLAAAAAGRNNTGTAANAAAAATAATSASSAPYNPLAAAAAALAASVAPGVNQATGFGQQQQGTSPLQGLLQQLLQNSLQGGQGMSPLVLAATATVLGGTNCANALPTTSSAVPSMANPFAAANPVVAAAAAATAAAASAGGGGASGLSSSALVAAIAALHSLQRAGSMPQDPSAIAAAVAAAAAAAAAAASASTGPTGACGAPGSTIQQQSRSTQVRAFSRCAPPKGLTANQPAGQYIQQAQQQQQFFDQQQHFNRQQLVQQALAHFEATTGGIGAAAGPAGSLRDFATALALDAAPNAGLSRLSALARLGAPQALTATMANAGLTGLNQSLFFQAIQQLGSMNSACQQTASAQSFLGGFWAGQGLSPTIIASGGLGSSGLGGVLSVLLAAGGGGAVGMSDSNAGSGTDLSDGIGSQRHYSGSRGNAGMEQYSQQD
eukprot:GHRR01008019.1.p1 GENE.GHRR01008019.1~~GHRR01008019.1.p1  ORF type:complete len:1090 (+),score=563.64 GHRR01008019.1:674-3943(+)